MRLGSLAKDGVKTCSKCQTEKPVESFYRVKDLRWKNGYHPWCKACQRKRAKEYSRTPRGRSVHKKAMAKHISSGKQKIAMDRWYAETGHRGARECGWKRNGIVQFSYADYERVFLQQQGRCAICQKMLSMKVGGENPTAHVDHDKTTGRVRGLLCPNCNHGIGQLKDDPALLEAAASYLRR